MLVRFVEHAREVVEYAREANLRGSAYAGATRIADLELTAWSSVEQNPPFDRQQAALCGGPKHKMSQRKPIEGEPAGGISSTFMALQTALRRYLLRFLVRRQDVEDVIQEAFLRAYEFERQERIDFPKSFLFKVAKNIALSEIDRKANRMTSYLSEVQDLNVADRQCIEDDADAQQRLAALSRVVAALPPQCRRVVIMKKVFGLSHAEIGRRLDISVRTVEKHLAKALKRCQESLQKDDTATVREIREHPRAAKMVATRGGHE